MHLFTRSSLTRSLAALTAVGSLLLAAACGSPSPSDKASSPRESTANGTALNLDSSAYDQLISSGQTAPAATVSANQWASAVKQAGVLTIGGTKTSRLFAQLDPQDSKVRGFDAGLSQLLAKYILGDASKVQIVQVDSSTREQVLENKQVAAVFATYSITPARQKVISYAGPYFSSQQGILVSARNKDIRGVDSLAGKKVATQAGSTGPDILKKYAPKATVQEFQTDQEAQTALKQGRVDAYVTDYTLLLNAVNQDAQDVAIAGKFGPSDPYGIGLPKGSDGVAFINDFLTSIEKNGTWAKLWKLTIGDRTNTSEVPTPPAITTGKETN